MADHFYTKIKWRCPSNIAIVKYWGKKDHQVPCNPSVSMTLSEAFTEVEMEISPKKDKDVKGVELEYFYEGIKNVPFQLRVQTYLESNLESFPFIKNHSIHINSSNNFPHSTGIASSASAFGAIALSLVDAQNEFSYLSEKKSFYKKASEMARLGSGSACRSMYGGFAIWGHHPNVKESSDQFAIELTDIHDNFKQMQDAILIVDDQQKKVSSSTGHSLMNNHPYAQSRFLQAQKNAEEIIKVLSNGDYDTLIQVAEAEALTLHAMMMTSHPYYLLMKPGTIDAIQKIVHFREETHTPVCFTLDAGPNVHVLYPSAFKTVVTEFINNDLKPFLKEVIFDKTGKGPEKLY
ncbi:MAG: hypothetical protein ABI325_10965 [Ginsengibacter sp.]